jgi:hypothetical protein
VTHIEKTVASQDSPNDRKLSLKRFRPISSWLAARTRPNEVIASPYAGVGMDGVAAKMVGGRKHGNRHQHIHGGMHKTG